MPLMPPPRHRRARRLIAGVLSLTLGALLAVTPAAFADDIRNREFWLDQYGIAQAWDVSQGAGVKVAVIDSGIDSSHPDLVGAVVGGADMSGSGNPMGTKGVGAEPEHGTLVATLLAGRGHPQAATSGSTPPSTKVGAGPDGVIGVAPQAELLSISVWLGSENPSGRSIDDQIPEAVIWAVDHGASVINMSLGSTSTAWPQSWDAAFAYAETKNVVVVAAAGNRKNGSEQVGAPATIPGVLAVGGLDADGNASVDSSSQGISIGVSAPAENLAGGLPGGGYARWSGSSGAAPIVAGVAALIRSKYPDMSAAQVINRIVSTATPKGEGRPNAFYGYGILDAKAALTADVPVVETNPLGSITDWIRVHRRGVQVPSSNGATASPIPQGPILENPTAPAALPEAELSSAAPATIVLGFLGLLALIVAGGGTHLVLVRRKLRAADSNDGTKNTSQLSGGGSGPSKSVAESSALDTQDAPSEDEPIDKPGHGL